MGLPQIGPLVRGDKVSKLTHIYPQKSPRKIVWPSAITRLTGNFTLCLEVDLVIRKHKKEYGST